MPDLLLRCVIISRRRPTANSQLPHGPTPCRRDAAGNLRVAIDACWVAARMTAVRFDRHRHVRADSRNTDRSAVRYPLEATRESPAASDSYRAGPATRAHRRQAVARARQSM